MTSSPTPLPALTPMSGLLSAQVRYIARLAHGMDPRLGLGALTSVATTGSRPLSARVSFDVGGDFRMHGGVSPSPSLLTPGVVVPLVAPGADLETAAEACLAKVHALSGLAWGALARADRTVLASVGDPVLDTLPDVAVRAMGILTGLDAEHRETCVWLGYAEGTLVVAPLDTACVVLCLGAHDEAGVLATLECVRFTLAGVDLSRVTPLPEPYRPPVAHDLTDEFGGIEEVEWEEWADEVDVPLTGARFAGAVGSTPRERRPRQGRWFRREDAS